MTAFQRGYDPRRNTIPPPNPNPPIEPVYTACATVLQQYIRRDSLSARRISILLCRHQDVLSQVMRGKAGLTLTEADALAIRWGCQIEDLIVEVN